MGTISSSLEGRKLSGAVILVADTAVGHRGVYECAGRRDETQPSELQGRCG